jgi:hypothetical protein
MISLKRNYRIETTIGLGHSPPPTPIAAERD